MTKNLTTGPPAKIILLFTLPLLIGNVFQQMYGFADAFVVGRILGIDALAAVGSTGGIAFLLLGFAWGLTAGFAIPTAQAFGAGDPTAVRRAVAAGTLLTGGFAVLLTAVAVPVARPLLELMRTPPEIIDDAYLFIVVSFWGIAATMFFNFLSSTIRALGDSRTPLVFLAISCVLNVVLVVAFIAGLGMGVDGAALRPSPRSWSRCCCASGWCRRRCRRCTSAGRTGGSAGQSWPPSCGSGCRWPSSRRS